MPDDIKSRVLGREDLVEAYQTRDITRIAASLNAEGRSFIGPRYVTARTVLAECQDGAAILVALESSASLYPAVKWAMGFLSRDSGLDMGNPTTLAMLETLRNDGVLAGAQASELRKMAERPLVVTQLEVAQALYEDNGDFK